MTLRWPNQTYRKSSTMYCTNFNNTILFHPPSISVTKSRTKIYHPGSQVKIDGALELYDNTLYCDLHNSMFVVPKLTHNNNNNNNSSSNITTPPSSSRANTVRIIAATKKPQSKITPIVNITTIHRLTITIPTPRVVQWPNQMTNRQTTLLFIAPVKEEQKKDGQKFEN